MSSDDNGYLCSICHDTEDSVEYVRIADCVHLFHKSCIELIIKSGHTKCPICCRDINYVVNKVSATTQVTRLHRKCSVKNIIYVFWLMTISVATIFSLCVLYEVFNFSPCRPGGAWDPKVPQCEQATPARECINVRKCGEGWAYSSKECLHPCTPKQMKRYIDNGGIKTTRLLGISAVIGSFIYTTVICGVYYLFGKPRSEDNLNETDSRINVYAYKLWFFIPYVIEIVTYTLTFAFYGITYGIKTSLMGEYTEFNFDDFLHIVVWLGFIKTVYFSLMTFLVNYWTTNEFSIFAKILEWYGPR